MIPLECQNQLFKNLKALHESQNKNEQRIKQLSFSQQKKNRQSTALAEDMDETNSFS